MTTTAEKSGSGKEKEDKEVLGIAEETTENPPEDLDDIRETVNILLSNKSGGEDDLKKEIEAIIGKGEGRKELKDLNEIELRKIVDVLRSAGMGAREETRELLNESQTVEIEGVEYDINTTTQIKINGDTIPEELSKLTNLTTLEANLATEIPNTLTNLTALYANSAKKIPNTLTNLTVLEADSAREIPNTFTNLTFLRAYSATEIPNTLTNLTILQADSAKQIPDTLTNLTYLYAYSAREIPNTLTNLTSLGADSAKKIPNTLTNLTTLYADSAREIPDTLTNLTYLYAYSAREIPDTLTNLTTLEADSATEIPKEFVNLKYIRTRAEFNPSDFPKLRQIWNYDRKGWKPVEKS